MAGKPSAELTLGRALGVRVLYVHMLLSTLENDHITLAEFGERVAAEERRLWPERATKKPYSASSVSRWEEGTEASLLAYLAMTSVVNRALKAARKAYRIDPGWLVFGDASGAPAPEIPQYTLAEMAEIRASGRGRPRKPR